MERKWMYLHDGETFGPFTVAQMRELALEGKIAPTDRIWGEGADPKTAIRAEQALTFKSPPKPEEKKVEKPKTPAKPASHSVGVKKVKKKGGSHSGLKKAQPKPLSPGTPETRGWGEGADATRESTPKSQPLEAIPVMEAIPLMEAIPVLETNPVQAAISPSLRRAIDAVQEPNLALGELYRRANFALSQWADQDENAELILAGDTEAILRQPEVLEILTPFQDVSFDVLERLMESLDFLVENRSKYYRAMMERGKKS